MSEVVMLVVETWVGQTLLAHARARGQDLLDLGTEVGLSATELRRLLDGTRRVDPELARRLARVLGGVQDDWFEPNSAALVTSWKQVAADFHDKSLKALRDRGHVTADRKDEARLAAELADFFECAPDEAENLTPAAFRQSPAYSANRDAVAVWLRLASLQADYVADLEDIPELDRDELSLLLPDLVQVGDLDPSQYLPRVKEQLADVGVVLVVQPDISGTRLFGASWPTPQDRGVVALTLQRRTDDFFWWTLFHECAHLILKHGPVVHDEEKAKGHQEEAADRSARQLILPRAWDASIRWPSKFGLTKLAERLGVPTGLLVGQLQHSDRVKPHHMHSLKARMPDPHDVEVRVGRERVSGPEWNVAVQNLIAQSDR